jgi:hypothetical protein
MSAYLFVHFKETTSPEGEQVYLGLSKDGFVWEKVNDGNPVAWCYYGDKGARDFTITYCKYTHKYYIIGTDLSLAYGMRNQYKHSWKEIARNGSKAFSIWESEDLIHWSEQRLATLGDENFGCLWAPDVIFDGESGDYILHWSSAHQSNDFGDKAIYYSRTRDFLHFSKPELLYRKPDGGGVIDSAIYEEDGKFCLFVKSERNPARIQMLQADSVLGPYQKMDAFDKSMSVIEEGLYEAPTAVKLDDGRWCLFLDYYGVPGAGQGYVPFVSENLSVGKFIRADEKFEFPYGFKHGTILKITQEDYERIKNHTFVEEDKR